jgi:hypothetical protein
MPIVDQNQVPKHGTPEPADQPEVQRQHEISAFAGEVLRELASSRIEATWSSQDARADLIRESLQHMIMVLTLVRDPDQALVRRRYEQCADGRVHRPVRDIQQTVGCGGLRKLIMEAGHRLRIVGVDRGE